MRTRASLHTLLTALSLAALAGTPALAEDLTFRIATIDLGDGYSIGGTITTDGTIGALTGANITRWNVTVEAATNLATYTNLNTSAHLSLVSATSTDLRIETFSTDGFTDGGSLAFRSGLVNQATLADFTSASNPGGEARYVTGGGIAFDSIDLNQPDGTSYLAANSTDGATYSITPLQFPNNVTVTGTITTTGATGAIDASDLVAWSILIREVTRDVFTETNSSLLTPAGLSCDGTNLVVTNPDGHLEFLKAFISGHRWSAQLADFTDGNDQAGYFRGRFLSQTISPVSTGPGPHVAATLIPAPAAATSLATGLALLSRRRRLSPANPQTPIG